MKVINNKALVALLFYMFMCIYLSGAEFRVKTEIEFINALQLAEANSEDDVIKVCQGHYYTGVRYWNEDNYKKYNITVLGGYIPTFLERVVNPLNTIIDGATGSSPVICLVDQGGGDIYLEGFTITRGAWGALLHSGDCGTPGEPSVAGGMVTVKNNIIRDINSIYSSNGGMTVFSRPLSASSQAIIANNIITDCENNSPESSYANGTSGGVVGWGYKVFLINNTIIKNNTIYGGGGATFKAVEVYVYNNIIWSNTSQFTADDIYLALTMGNEAYGYNNDYSDILGTWKYSGGNIHVDPEFVELNDYHLKSSSPCIDHGTNSAPSIPTIDIDGTPRIYDGNSDGISTADIGADEFVYWDPHVLFPIYSGHDFDGNLTSDVSVWRPTSGYWYIRNIIRIAFGIPGDIPVSGDYDGNGATDIAIFRPATALWDIKDQFSVIYGLPGDIPVPGDYDGDGDTDLAIYKPILGTWKVKDQFTVYLGGSQDVPVPGDYDGDGDTDAAVFNIMTGHWRVKNQFHAYLGREGDIPVPADYNGDGITEVAIYRPSAGMWAIMGQPRAYFGTLSDIPAPGDYDGNGTTDIAIFRPSTGMWAVKGQFRVFYGRLGDVPLVR